MPNAPSQILAKASRTRRFTPTKRSFDLALPLLPLLLLLLLSLSFAPIAQAEPIYYCGQLSSEQAGGATGYFQMYSISGSTTYTFEFDLKDFNSTCDFSGGLKYQIKTYWNDNSSTSAYGARCGNYYTGGTYDPGFACSEYSQYASTDCVDLNRTTAQGYTYECTTTAYGEGEYALCEKGDLSSKFGIAMPLSDDSTYFVSTTGPFVSSLDDYDPPYPGNWKNPDEDSLSWSSVVFSCNDNAERLFCADLTKSTSSCDTGTDDEIYWTTWDIILLTLGIAIILAVATFIFLHFLPTIRERQIDEAKIMEWEEASASASDKETEPLI